MTNRNRLLYALVLLPTLLLTSCYKDFDKVRIKPFKPDLVVPLAAVDSITFADMLVKDEDESELDRSYDDKRIGLKYPLATVACSNTKEFKNGGELAFSKSDPKKIIGSLFLEGSADVESVKEITFEKDAVLKSATNMRLPLKEGGEFVLEANNDFTVPEASTVSVESVSEDGKVDVKEGGIRSVKVVRKKFSSILSLNDLGSKEIGVYKGLLWYSGQLTDPKVVLKVVRTGWLRNVKINYWFDQCYLEVKGGSGTKQALHGKDDVPLPFNTEGRKDNKGTLDANLDTVETTYEVGASNLGELSKDWPIRINLGKLFGEVETPQEFQLDKNGSSGKAESEVTFKLPFTGRFNALIREFKGGDKDGSIQLPDVNSLLQDSGSKGGVKSKFTDNDTVLLHFYFKNATPMDIYLAAKVGDWNPSNKGAETKNVAAIENVPDSKIGEQTIEGTSYTLDDFNFFLAVGGAKVKKESYGIVEDGAVQTGVATIAIPYRKYEEARESAAGRQLTALLLFRSPDGADGKPIVVSPRLTDYVSIRLGVEVKPEVSIELMNKE